MARSKPVSLLSRLKNFDAHHRLIVSGIASLLVLILTAGRLRIPMQIVMAWNAFGYCVLALAWVRIASSEPSRFLRTAKLQDSSRITIFFSVVAAACTSVFAVAYFLGTAKGLTKGGLTAHVLVALVTVIGSWCLIHTIFALHYAHLYYRDGENGSNSARRAGGLEFPREPAPDYLDFAYFSFVIGMTCQVSDVQITDRGIRRLALFHGLVSFAFNTVILALSINIVSGLFGS